MRAGSKPEISITSRDNARVRAWRKLQTDARARRSERRTLLEGIHLVRAYVDRVGAPREMIVTPESLANAEIAAIIERVARRPIVVSKPVFAALADAASPVGVAAEIDLPVEHPDLSASVHCVLVEGVQDAGNLGAVLRSAAAFGVDSVVVGPGSADAWSPKVLRAAMGGHFFLRIAQTKNLAQAISGFTGLKLCTVPRGGEALAKLDLTGPVAWILGSEGGGVSAPLAAKADALARIAMTEGTESLNVAAAAAICFYERSRKLNPPD
ncbi:MAG: RNA methyltransferase [Betaproteobacteria bacterium]|nr:RNA methyltransferase [Betaproteobacteria bacterium]